jgi:sugar phosphate isomerase/epimerase
MSFRYAICNETFQDWPFPKAFRFARECGYTGIEFAPYTMHKNAFDITPDQRESVRRLAEGEGLEVVGLHWLLAFTQGYYLTSPERDVRHQTSLYLQELARLCRDLGGKYSGFGIPETAKFAPGSQS